MKQKLTMTLACLFLLVGSALAQTKVTGVVTSSEDGQPVTGVSVKVVGTTVGALTNLDVLLSAKHSVLHPNSLPHCSLDDFMLVTSPLFVFCYPWR